VQDAEDQRLTRATACSACGVVNDDAKAYLLELEQRVLELQEKVANVTEDNHKKSSEIRRLKRDSDRQLQNDPHYEQAVEVLEYWRDMLHPEARQLFGGERLKNVLARLSDKDGKPYTTEELKLCVRGYVAFPYVVNSRRTAHGSPATRRIDAELIFRDPQRVENGKAYAEEAERRAEPLPHMTVGPTKTHPTPKLSALGVAAVRLADFGFYVFPVVPKGKVPGTTHGLNDATRDIERITSFWSQKPHYNIGIRCGVESQLVVLDVDVDEAKEDNGSESLRLLEATRGKLPPTASVVTPRGGQHYYFRHPDQGEIRNATGYPGPGLDVRGCGGYVLAPPSIGPNSKRYEVDDSLPIAPMPAWLIELLVNRQSQLKNVTRKDFWKLLDEGVTEGQRDDQMTRLIGHLWSHDHEPEEILGWAMLANEKRWRPPMAVKDVEKCLRSVAGMRARQALVHATQ
jgi:hypothetical protein